MPELIANCPRCDAQKVTFLVEAAHITGQEYGWMNWYEVCAQCRHCHRYTVFAVFNEGAMCQAVRCYNAACAMYRLSVDLTTKSLLPPESEPNGPNANQRDKLFDRVNWLFDTGRLSASLRHLSHCIRQDGTDAVHDGSVAHAEAADLQDFTVHLLENVYTAPERLRLAAVRRAARRKP